jgi:hypothetical protein
MAFALKGNTTKILVAAGIIAIVVFLLWPKFRGTTGKYEDDFYMDEGFEEEDDEGFEDGEYDEESFEEEDGDFYEDEGFGPMEGTAASLQPALKAQASLQSARPDLPGVNIATDLLPKPALAQADWAEFAPKALGAQNFVDATTFVGVNTQGSALKNANYGLRADIPIPRIDTGPWSNSTIESGDLSRKPLE